MAASTLKKLLEIWDAVSGHPEDFAAYEEEYPEGSACNPAVEAYRIPTLNREVCAKLGEVLGEAQTVLYYTYPLEGTM